MEITRLIIPTIFGIFLIIRTKYEDLFFESNRHIKIGKFKWILHYCVVFRTQKFPNVLVKRKVIPASVFSLQFQRCSIGLWLNFSINFDRSKQVTPPLGAFTIYWFWWWWRQIVWILISYWNIWLDCYVFSWRKGSNSSEDPRSRFKDCRLDSFLGFSLLLF